MDYEALEDAIVTKLTADLVVDGNIIIEALPDADLENIPATNKPRLTVAYHHSIFGEGRYGDSLPTISTGPSIQDENIRMSVEIEARSKRGTLGVYDLIFKVRQSILGYQPLNIEKLKLVEVRFVKHVNNNFIYSVTFGTKSIAIEDVLASTDPLLKKVSLTEEYLNPYSE